MAKKLHVMNNNNDKKKKIQTHSSAKMKTRKYLYV